MLATYDSNIPPSNLVFASADLNQSETLSVLVLLDTANHDPRGLTT